MELLISNILFVGYIVLSLWQMYKHGDTMGDGSMHHFLSHLYIVITVFISVNIFVWNGAVVPLILAGVYILQHVTKENLRLIKTNKWTPDIKEDEICETINSKGILVPVVKYEDVLKQCLDHL